jgi:foldase protein PrsA
MYRVTQVLPFPVARSGGQLISYENYLFELRHYMHYYETQAQLDFKSSTGKAQLAEYKQRALDKVINDAYIKRLAEQNGVTVSNAELDEQIQIARSQNRLGEGDRVFEDILKDYWGWSIDDFRRSLRQQLLAQKVLAKLDTETADRANAALTELKGGADFAAVAQKYSQDADTKDGGGEFPSTISKTDRALSAVSTNAMFNLKNGEYSDIIVTEYNSGYCLQIVKAIENNGDRVKAAHIVFYLKDISTYINDLKEKQPVRMYLKLPTPATDATVETPVQP